MDELDLPVKVKAGHIGKLVLKIPWKNLYTDSVVAEIDGIYALAVPNIGRFRVNFKTCSNIRIDDWLRSVLLFLIDRDQISDIAVIFNFILYPYFMNYTLPHRIMSLIVLS